MLGESFRSNNAGKCMARMNFPADEENPFRYPLTMAPGNVDTSPTRVLVAIKPGSLLFKIVGEFLPNLMGALIFLFFLSTSLFLSFSVIRLFYLDTLKPYKRRKLKALGKNRYHYRYANEFGDKKVHRLSKYPMESSKRRKTRESYASSDDDDDRDIPSIIHPPGRRLSFTSPPQRVGNKPNEGRGYPDVMDLMTSSKLPVFRKFPSSSRLYTGAKGIPTRIPILINKQGGKWGWDKTWYKKQVVDESATKLVVDQLKSTRDVLKETVSEHAQMMHHSPMSSPEEASVDSLSETDSKMIKFSNLMNSLKNNNAVPEVENNRGENISSILPQLDQLQAAALSETPKKKRKSKRRSQRTDLHSLLARYTFRNQQQNVLHTRIPKIQKKSYHQLMILRAGPRKKASTIELERKQRKSSDATGAIEDEL